MNKRQHKKAWNKFIYAEGKCGCEYCRGISGPVMITSDGWTNLSIKISKDFPESKNKNWKIILKEKDENNVSRSVCYVNTRYCFNCGRKLK